MMYCCSLEETALYWKAEGSPLTTPKRAGFFVWLVGFLVTFYWRRGQQRMRWLDSITDSMDMNLSKTREIVKNRGACRATVHGITKS